ncbi:MAG: 1-acyl-sn-glycerol-3-phosphate acyltransferase [Candidatus Desulforudis sp.]|jgi:1-acyl-sn-glycerol-3-phosphate acyltransferase|nr:1-acyl-sn-glycerol-3-phosphate acyltransferase [Desulforudis sp.]MBV1768918.1 1-acyl-sn-glycerol-3-phosphate acyltransferase [Desulforudis sp.]MDP3049879.1 lysophospholipid acyltransferase family protein [Eubacteriales bacterium]
MTYTLVKLVSKWFLWILGNPNISGQTNIPRTGPVIVVANHTSLLDGFLLAAFWPRRITFLSAAYLFRLPVVGAFFHSIGAIPVQSDRSELAGVRTALRVLQSGGTLALFPEGQVCTGDKLCPFQMGWAYLALKVGVPVLPVVIKGTRTALPLGAVFPRRSKIYIQIAAPWTLEKVERPRQETLAAFNTRLVGQMEDMLNEMQGM